jgi:hypothetical protein
MPGNSNGWAEYKLLVVGELTRLSDEIVRLSEKVEDLRTDIAELKIDPEEVKTIQGKITVLDERVPDKLKEKLTALEVKAVIYSALIAASFTAAAKFLS